jgi:hypothetical protein
MARHHPAQMNIFRRLPSMALCALGCLGAAACSSTPTTYLEDGTRGYAVTCKGYLNSWQNCLIEAGRICQSRGYRAIAGEEYDRSMIIACRDGATPK